MAFPLAAIGLALGGIGSIFGAKAASDQARASSRALADQRRLIAEQLRLVHDWEPRINSYIAQLGQQVQALKAPAPLEQQVYDQSLAAQMGAINSALSSSGAESYAPGMRPLLSMKAAGTAQDAGSRQRLADTAAAQAFQFDKLSALGGLGNALYGGLGVLTGPMANAGSQYAQQANAFAQMANSYGSSTGALLGSLAQYFGMQKALQPGAMPAGGALSGGSPGSQFSLSGWGAPPGGLGSRWDEYLRRQGLGGGWRAN